MRFVKLLLLSLVIAGVAGGAYWGLMQSNSAAVVTTAQPSNPVQQGVPVEATEVRIADLSRMIDAVGTLLSDESVVIRPEIAGRIVEIGFEEGQGIKKGDMVVRLDSSTLRAELAQTKAALELSRKNFERAKQLYGKGAGTARALDEAQSKLKVDEASVVLAEVMLRKTTIRAPFGGIVGMRRISPGDYVSPGQDIVNIEAIDPIKIDFRVPETALTSVAVGQEIAIGLDAFGDDVFVGTVYSIDPKVDAHTRSFSVRARIANPSGALRPGLFARVVLHMEMHADAILVPEEAVVPIGDKKSVYKVVDGKVALTEVTLGLRQNGDVEISKGLEPRDIVVIAGQQKLRDGAPVMVLPSAPGA